MYLPMSLAIWTTNPWPNAGKLIRRGKILLPLIKSSGTESSGDRPTGNFPINETYISFSP